MSVLVEIVCCSVDDCVQAERGGANRIELCSALNAGGLTPSLGLVREAKQRCGLPLMTMVRPRPGGFCYSDGEFETMRRDIELVGEAHGLVFGVLDDSGFVDEERCKRLVRDCGDRQKVFHRAFDVTPDPFAALEQLVDLGFTRVLTSGQASSALEGTDLIRRLIECADGRIEVLPGGGIRATNANLIVERTACDQVHLAPFNQVEDPSTKHRPDIHFGAPSPPEGRYALTDGEIVRQVVAAVQQLP